MFYANKFEEIKLLAPYKFMFYPQFWANFYLIN